MEKVEPEKMSKMVPVRFVMQAWVPLVVIYFLPAGGLMLIFKILLGLWIFQVVYASFSNMWIEDGYIEMRAFVVQAVVSHGNRI